MHKHWVPTFQAWEVAIQILQFLFLHHYRLSFLNNSSLDYTCTFILGWKAFIEGQIISGMWTPRTQQKDQIDILEMKETCLLISNRTFSTCLNLATYNTTAVAYLKGQSLLYLGPLKIQITMSHRPYNWEGGTSNYLVTLLLYVRTICQEIRKNEKKRRLIPFQNELKLWALWLKFKSANSKSQWAQK